jgi:hypothetical protein
VREEFMRRTQEEADIEAHENAAELFYSNQEAENEREAYALYLEDKKKRARRASRTF